MPFETGHAILHEPKSGVGARAGHGLLLTHGAGSSCNSPLLVAVADAFAGVGFTVLRCNLPFRQQRPFGPPGRYDATRDRAGLKEWVEQLRERINGPLFFGGHSYGGRQASILASEEPDLCKGLLLLSYPLHPPKKPDQLRTAHFQAIRIPVVFVQGDQDPFATIGELSAAAKLISAQTAISVVANKGHDLAHGRFDITACAVGPFLRLIT